MTTFASLRLGILSIVSLQISACQTTRSEAKPGERFAAVDTDRSGQLSRDEVNAYLVTSVFDSRDANHDKTLTKSEWTTGSDEGQEKLFHLRDKNGDGVVTMEEALAYGRKKGIANSVMAQADQNHDGQLSHAEVKAFYGSKEGSPF